MQSRCAKRQLSYYKIWNRIFSLKVLEGGPGWGWGGGEGGGAGWGGGNPEYPEKNPDSLPANRYYIIIRGENPASRAGLEPSPSNIGDKLAIPRARAASDPLCFIPTQLQTH